MTFPVLSAGTSAYNLTNSLRFRSSASAYLNRTPSVAGDQQKFTWSGWVKLGALVDETFVSLGTTLGVNLRFTSYALQSNILTVGSTTSTSVYRDPSSWYHIVLAVDTTQASNNNRLRLYVNGNEVTYSANATITQNANLGANTTTIHALGVEARLGSATAGTYFDGYMVEINFIDGQALTPSSFGSTNPVTGVWQPAKYTGTYGTNGFYLPFTNTTSTTTLGNDFSGNGNNWTTNNISLTPGATYDAMTDVPTLTSPTAANFAVMNPLQIGIEAGSEVTLTNGNLTITGSGNVSQYRTWYASIQPPSGKFYFEFVVSGLGSDDKVSQNISTAGLRYNSDGTTGAGTSYGTAWAVNDVVGCSVDFTNGYVWYSLNGTWQNSATSAQIAAGVTTQALGPSTSDKKILAGDGSATTNSFMSGSFNFGQRPFAYTPPSGFLPLNTFNLPNSTIPNGASFMAATLATGNNSTQVITNTVGSASFQPDFVWMKIRSTSENHIAYDSVRGVQNYIVPNLTLAEGTSSQGLTSFNSNGFTLGNINPNYTGSPTFVAWQWKAGGAGVTNTAGSITSTVSANTTSGFSVVTYTGTGSTATVGHGLNVTPSMVIVKRRDSSTNGDWFTYTAMTGNANALYLNLTNASAASGGAWNNTSPTSSVFTVGTSTGVNASASTYVAYCFAPIAGFSAFGSYTGNGSSDGPFIYTGFRPRWVLVKSSSAVGNWQLLDTSRSTYNVSNANLYPNLANAEVNGGNEDMDILSNGFKPRNASASFNVSGTTYIYACFAENPFKNALAR